MSHLSRSLLRANSEVHCLPSPDQFSSSRLTSHVYCLLSRAQFSSSRLNSQVYCHSSPSHFSGLSLSLIVSCVTLTSQVQIAYPLSMTKLNRSWVAACDQNFVGGGTYGDVNARGGPGKSSSTLNLGNLQAHFCTQRPNFRTFHSKMGGLVGLL